MQGCRIFPSGDADQRSLNLQDVIQFQYDLSGDEEESKRGHDAKRRHEEEVDTTSLETSRKKLRKFSVPFANAQPDLKK